MAAACQFINEKISVFLQGRELPLNKSALNHLGAWYQRQIEKQESTMDNSQANLNQSSSPRQLTLTPYAVRAVLEAVSGAYGITKSSEHPHAALYEQVACKPLGFEAKMPKLMFTLFNGGKSQGSKVKFRRFYLIMDMTPAEAVEHDALMVFHRVSAALRKGVSAGKGGEAGFKPANGTWWNAHENHNETFKVIEEAINSACVNVSP